VCHRENRNKKVKHKKLHPRGGVQLVEEQLPKTTNNRKRGQRELKGSGITGAKVDVEWRQPRRVRKKGAGKKGNHRVVKKKHKAIAKRGQAQARMTKGTGHIDLHRAEEKKLQGRGGTTGGGTKWLPRLRV